MRAEPFIQAELRKGDVLSEAVGQVQQYSLMRHKAAVEVQMSESLLAAEEEMMTLASQLRDSTDIYNVFKPDGSGTWSDSVNDMRERLADRIESRSARDEFRARFNQAELTRRFQLRGAIDERIQARANAAAAARMQAAEDALSNPYNPTGIADYDMAVMGIRIEQDAATRSGTATPETTGVMNAQLAVNVATRTTAAYVFDDPGRAIALAEALDLQDEVDAGRMTLQQAYEQANLDDDAAYTLYTLDVLPRDKALEIIYDTLARSNRLYEAAERQRTEREAQATAANESTYRAMFFFSDPSQRYTTTQIMRLAPDVAREIDMDPNQEITSDQARRFFMDYFNMSNYLSPEQRRQIETTFAAPAVSSFATQTNQDVYTDLFARAEAGNLTVVGLNAARSSITPENYTTLLNKIGAEADDALSDVKNRIRLQFRYNELDAANDIAGARAAQSAFFSVASDLEIEAQRRRAEGNPMTRSELIDFGNALVESQAEFFRAIQISERDNYINFFMTNIPGIGYQDPLADLEAWYQSLDAAGQQAYAQDRARHRIVLLEFQQRINR